MSTSVHFNLFNHPGEQSLLDDWIVESIKIYGHDCYYLPRRMNNIDKIYGEDITTEYNKAYAIEAYIKSLNGFEGEGSILTSFGLEIKDSIIFTLAKRTFDIEIGNIENFSRPREGDILYFPLNKKCFIIRFVNNKPFFYQLGELQTYEISCELFDYSHEKFNTGIEEIDDIQTKLSMNILDHALKDSDGNYIKDSSNNFIMPEEFDLDNFDPFADNNEIQKESDDILDFSEINPLVGDDGKY